MATACVGPSGPASIPSRLDSFFDTFGHTATNTRSVNSSNPDGSSTSLSVHPLNSGDSSLVNTDSRLSAGAFYQTQPSNIDTMNMPGWGSDMNPRHPLSPPDSASYSPKEWSFDFQTANSSNTYPNIQSNDIRSPYGLTPPDDNKDNAKLLDHQLQQSMKASPGQKRKLSGDTANASSSQPAKRSRKRVSRGPNIATSIDPNKPEDFRRFKFLERNRVAASKCRQKKKEWTQNLEHRARQLQKTNSSLRLMVESLRQEVLFLKGEMLKHDQCDCSQVQQYLVSSANAAPNQFEQDLLFKREPSPIESKLPTRSNSVKSEFGENGLLTAHDASTDRDDESVLESLLTSSIAHDTSESGIALQAHR